MGSRFLTRCVAAGFAIGALWHAAGFAASLAGHPLRDYSAARDALFIIVDAGLSGVALGWPRWLWAPLSIFLVQQSTTHGREVLRRWQETHSVAWLSLTTLVFVSGSLVVAIAVRLRPSRTLEHAAANAPAL